MNVTEPSKLEAHIASLDQDIAEAKEHVTSLEHELTEAKAYLARLEAGRQGLMGQTVDQHALRSARSKWAQARRRGRPKAEVDQAEREYRAMFKGNS
jgi:septal ring factor EnvC (AmiA/AmiB activator)